MAKRKPTATQKLRKLVQQQVRRMERRGYRIDAGVKQKIKTGKYQTLKSLQRDKYKKLYEKSTSEIEGKVVSGTEKRTQERRESARRAAQTRQQAKRPDVRWGEAEPLSEDEVQVRWEEERRKQDERDRARAELFQEGQIVYDQVMSLIDQYPTPGSKYLTNLLLSEIAKYGRAGLLEALGQAPAYFIDSAKVIVYYEEDSDAIHSALHDFAQMITGTLTSAEEAKEMGDVMDEMTDMGAL